MPRPRYHRLSDDKKQRILKAALEEFSQNEFDQASYNRIIEQAGISKGAMYYYFDDKADLYVTLLEHVVADKFSLLDDARLQATSAAAYWDAMERVSAEMLHSLDTQPELIQLGRNFARLRPDELGARGAELWALATRKTAEWIERGQRVGAVRTDLEQELLVQLVIALDSVLDRWWLEHHDHLPTELAAPATRLWLDLMRRLLEPRNTDPDAARSDAEAAPVETP